MIRVVLADDQALVLRGLEALLGAEPDIEVVGTAADGGQALELVRDVQPDVACLDIRMPGMDGIEVTRALLGESADVPAGKQTGAPGNSSANGARSDAETIEAGRAFTGSVLILTTFDIDEYVFGALEAGASGFLLKDAEPDTIANAVRRVAVGEGTLDQSLTKRIMREFAARRTLRPVRKGSAASTSIDSVLTERETQILHLLAQGLSNADIAARLYVEQATVKSHLARMLPKLGVSSRLQAVVWAYQNHVVQVE